MSYGNGYSGDALDAALSERAGSREELQAVSQLIVAMLNYHPLLVAVSLSCFRLSCLFNPVNHSVAYAELFSDRSDALTLSQCL